MHRAAPLHPYRVVERSPARRPVNTVARLLVGPLGILWVLSLRHLLTTPECNQEMAAAAVLSILLVPLLLATGHAALRSSRG